MIAFINENLSIAELAMWFRVSSENSIANIFTVSIGSTSILTSHKTTDGTEGVEAIIGEAIDDQYRHTFSSRGQFT